MYNLVVLSCLMAVAFAKPGYLEHHGLKTFSVHSEVPVVKTALVHEPATVAVQEHTLAKIGEHVEHIPTSVSHHSSSVVHSKANIVTPIIAPAVKTHYAPAVKTVEKQYIENVPVVHSYVEPTVVKSYGAPAYVQSYAAPTFVKSYDSSAFLKSYDSSAFVKSYGAPTLLKSYSAPALYSAHVDSYAPYAHSAHYRSELPVHSSW